MPQVELYAERSYVRETAKRNMYTGKTYNSVENISQFLCRARHASSVRAAAPELADAGSGHQVLGRRRKRGQSAAATDAAIDAGGCSPKKKAFGAGSTVRHPKYGRGTVLRREGEGDDAKLTISFPGYGLKKIIEKFAGMREE